MRSAFRRHALALVVLAAGAGCRNESASSSGDSRGASPPPRSAAPTAREAADVSASPILAPPGISADAKAPFEGSADAAASQLADDADAATSGVLWRGHSAGLTFEWTTGGLRVAGGRKALDLFARPEEYDDCESDASYRLLSVVGAVVSYEETESAYCQMQAHPSHFTSYSAVDAAHGSRKVELTSLFPESDVREALLGDRLVRTALSDAGLAAPPSLGALVKALANDVSTPCEYAFNEGMLSAFALHHVERRDGGRAQLAVRIGLSHGCEAARGNLTQLGILLPLDHASEAFVRQVEMAERRVEGFLMREEPSIAGDRSTEFQVGQDSRGSPTNP